jgi:hypothetical protein
VVSAGGLGLGVLVSAAFVEFLPPRGAALRRPVRALRDRVRRRLADARAVASRSRRKLTPQWPSVPSAVRRPFFLAALGVMSSWSIGGLFLSWARSSPATSSTPPTTSWPAPRLRAGRLGGGRADRPRSHAAVGGAAAGSVALSAGMVLIVIASSTDSSVVFLTGAIIGGAGFGVAFLGALRALSAVIPNEHRAAVMSAFYVVATRRCRSRRSPPASS